MKAHHDKRDALKQIIDGFPEIQKSALETSKTFSQSMQKVQNSSSFKKNKNYVSSQIMDEFKLLKDFELQKIDKVRAAHNLDSRPSKIVHKPDQSLKYPSKPGSALSQNLYNFDANKQNKMKNIQLLLNQKIQSTFLAPSERSFKKNQNMRYLNDDYATPDEWLSMKFKLGPRT